MKKFNFKLIAVFTDSTKGFKGNIAAIIETEDKIEKTSMQEIALQLNQPATSFIYKSGNETHIRWYAPDSEILMCGHGSMAAAAYFKEFKNDIPNLHYRRGTVSSFITDDELIRISLPIGTYKKDTPPHGLKEALGVEILDYFSTSDKDIVLVEDQETLHSIEPNFFSMKKMEPFGYAVTAKGNSSDFASRTLVPKVQQLEDHATGSSHTVLIPYWSDVLKKNELIAHQLSPRGGYFNCVRHKDTVELSGNYEIVGEGKIYL